MKHPCPACGYYMEAEEGVCPFCKTSVTAGAPDAKAPSGSKRPALGYVSSLMGRYNDAYLVASVTVRFGKIIKMIAIILAVMLMWGGIATVGTAGRNDAQEIMGTLIIMLGVIVGVLFYVAGVLVAAQGQILKASLDSAVNSSPFLTNELRAKIMSLSEA